MERESCKDCDTAWRKSCKLRRIYMRKNCILRCRREYGRMRKAKMDKENGMLKRKFSEFLLGWKKRHGAECLLVKGARQIGKTFTIDRFGREHYESYLCLNFITNPEHREIFRGSLEAGEIFKRLTLAFQDFRLVPGKTLLFFDEIQNCPAARTAFKPLALDGRADVIGSGSLLGMTFLDGDRQLQKERREASVPVGYERQATMHSLDFEEFLWALGYREDAVGILREAFEKGTALPAAGNARMMELYREYIAVGGMPQVVVRFREENSFSVAYGEQRKIIDANLDDIAKYAPTAEKPKIRACYLSIPGQLARENAKFKYAAVEHGGSARKFGASVDWLRESSLAVTCHNVESPSVPLAAYRKGECFKLFAGDIGILAGMMGFEVKERIVRDTLAGPAKGGIYENAVLCALVRRGYEPCYYLPKSNLAEIDFLVERDGAVVPIEVKAGNGPSASFDRMLERKDVAVGYKFVNGNVGRAGKKVTLPHYMAMFL